jgi:hypothetical protein
MTVDGPNEGGLGGAECRPTGFGKAGVDGASIGPITLAGEQPALLEPIDRLGHRALANVEQRGDVHHPQPTICGHGDLTEQQVLGQGETDFALKITIEGSAHGVNHFAQAHPRLQAFRTLGGGHT